jgi:hypothetical protein
MGRKIHWDHHRLVGHAEDPNEIFHNVENRPPGLAVIRGYPEYRAGAARQAAE